MSLKQRIHSKEAIKIAGVPFGCTRDEMEAALSQDDYDLIGTDHPAWTGERRYTRRILQDGKRIRYRCATPN